MNVQFHQLKPISSLPRKYNEYVKEAEKKGAVIFMKKSKPKSVLVDFKVWEKLVELQQQIELQDALQRIQASEEDIASDRYSKASSLADLL
jgi:prevent-host-death family protein